VATEISGDPRHVGPVRCDRVAGRARGTESVPLVPAGASATPRRLPRTCRVHQMEEASKVPIPLGFANHSAGEHWVTG
jgi:hypothetical protein